MRRYIITGAPGAGKTSVLHALRRLGFATVAEATTDVIADEQALGHDEPWHDPLFLIKILELQRDRQLSCAAGGARAQIFDRSPVCTLALARHLGRPVPPPLAAEIERITAERIYEPEVFFVRPIGFIEATAARRISYAESLVFEAAHERAYREHGFEIMDVPPAGIEERAALVAAQIAARPGRERGRAS
jgi:predicted ATPase